MKFLCIIVIAFCFLAGCKPAQFAFRESELNLSYFQTLMNAAGGISTTDPVTDTTRDVLNRFPEDFTRDTFSLYVANLTDKAVIRDGIAEESIMNKENKSKLSGTLRITNSYKLYLMLTYNPVKRYRGAIFLPAIFNADDSCIGLGPALVGQWGPGQLDFVKRLKFKPVTKEKNIRKYGKIKIEYPRSENNYRSSGSIYHPKDRSITKTEITFRTDTTNNLINLYSFSVRVVLNIGPNRFGGMKPLIYDIEEIFDDPNALYFTIVSPSKKQ